MTHPDSFVPPRPIRVLRHFTRLRVDPTADKPRHWQRLAKLQEDPLIKTSSMASRMDTRSDGGIPAHQQTPRRTQGPPRGRPLDPGDRLAAPGQPGLRYHDLGADHHNFAASTPNAAPATASQDSTKPSATPSSLPPPPSPAHDPTRRPPPGHLPLPSISWTFRARERCRCRARSNGVVLDAEGPRHHTLGPSP